ncbi:c-type cytochrome biogenesis protein CcsB (plasmid) [Citricoccus sp. SGAir0253]|uniref:c-type cytochrome biogenesis protein CcsB n=1 Tax=Citricoccus sp. SGAir0253 TaxID=2567881 RepID=UPI0010CD19BF|nr:c-type cytochrome biogenesis protein CcsB [Citricoccus sp. SGAir0253]QCU79671.1 c-type cytochrome biogenesis protein CcsB [Citricoccus sp. SGAir0253]
MQPINLQLASYSDLFMLIAALVYAVAFILFALDLATSSKTIRALEAELARERDVDTTDTTASPARRDHLVGAGVGGPARGAGTGSTTVPGARPHLTGADTGAGGAGGSELVDEDMDYLGTTARPVANVAVALMVIAAAVHAFAVIARAVAASRVPWGNMYEFCTTGAMLVSVVYLLFLIRKDIRFLGTFVAGLVVIMMAAATIGFPTPIAHLQPALQSPWIIIHVSIAVLASALFTLTFAMSVLQLIQHRREATARAGTTPGLVFMRLVPSAVSLENWSYRINAVGFVMWTFTLIAGAIWAEASWGRYWGWDTKEVWTFVIWVVYAGYLHARATRGWTGERAAWLSIIGYCCIVFNFTIVNTYFPGLHSYAGLPS